jgi:enoyl-CoA hydratase/carnithine racemase
MTTSPPSWHHVAVTSQDGIVELRFHTDDGPMVWTADTHREATEAFAWIGSQHDTKVVIITGTGDTFCSQLDVTGFAALPWDHIWWEGQRMLRNLNDIEVPVIGVANGPATIHAEIPVMGDIVIADHRAEFADHAHFPLRDTVPGDGVQLVWRELLGPTRAKYWLLTGATIDAEEALRLGIVNELHDGAVLNARAWEIARDLARRSVPLLRYAKAVVSMGTRESFNTGLAYGLALEGGGYMTKGGMKAENVSAPPSRGA